jgi:hypothetical protein
MTRTLGRRRLLAALGVAATAGCLSVDDEGTQPATDSETPTVTTQPPTDNEAAAPPVAEERLPLPLEPDALREKAISGGPPKDGIPSIDDPSFITADEAPEGLAPQDPVFGVVLDGEVKAYSQKILAQHEICNDVVGDTPGSVTYCPLTGTAMGFYRGETTFGVSGRLVNNNLIMYDRATEAWWPQVLATSIPGPWEQDPEIRSLRQFPAVWTTWERWPEQYPGTQLLSRKTGYARNDDYDPYGSYNPREGYYHPEQEPMFPALSPDDQIGDDIPLKAVVIGARTGDGAAAFEKAFLREEGLAEGTLAETPVLAVYDPGLDTGYVYLNPDEREFEHRAGEVVDADGGTHAPDGLGLDQLIAFDAMWFAWAGFYPETTLYV